MLETATRTDAQNECLRVLLLIWELWPNRDLSAADQMARIGWPVAPSELARWRSPLAHLITNDFDDLELTLSIDKPADISRIQETDDKVTIEFVNSVDYPHRAILSLSGGGKWLLKSLVPACAACFGTGRDESAACPLCEGACWT